jgi:transposase
MSEPVGRPRRSRDATRLLWAQRLSRFAAAEQSAAAFCAAEGVSPNSFFYWKRRLAGPAVAPDAGPRFLPVRVAPPSPVEVVLPGGAVLRLSPGCDLAFVRSLVGALAGAPC